MALVKCNHCGKNTRNDNPLYLGKCTKCGKELDKNITEIKEQYQDENTRIENIERMSATKKFDEDVKKHKRMIRIVSSILMIFFAVFWRNVGAIWIVIVPGFILLYLNIRFEKKSEKKRKDIINRYYSEKKPKNN